MKVRELVKRLNALDQDLDVLCCTEDEGLLAGRPGFLLLHIEGVDTMAGEHARDEAGKAGFKVGSGKPTVAVLQVTADF